MFYFKVVPWPLLGQKARGATMKIKVNGYQPADKKTVESVLISFGFGVSPFDDEEGLIAVSPDGKVTDAAELERELVEIDHNIFITII